MTSAVNINTTYEQYARRRFLDASFAETYRSEFTRPVHRVTESRPESLKSDPDVSGDYWTPLPWSHVSSNTQMASEVLLQQGAGYDERLSESGFWYPDVVGLNYSRLQDQAIIKAAAGLGDNVRQMNVFFREAAEVVHLAQQFGNGVQRGLHSLIDICQGSWVARRGMRNFIRHGWKEVPSVYLGYIFGVAPLAGDLENAVNTLNDLIAANAEVPIVAKAVVTSEERYETQCQAVFGDVYYFAKIRRAARAKAILRFIMDSSTLGALQFLTPFSQAYETTRLSFVLDYILPVGPWLSAVESCQVAPYFRDGSVSLKVVDTPVGAEAYSSRVIISQKCEASGFYRHYQRKVLDSFPYQTILKPPRFKLPGIKQLGVTAALIGQSLTTLTKTISQR